MEKREQWERIKDLFDAAVDLDAKARDAFLSDACGPDLELQVEIESLLAAYEKADGLSRTPWCLQDVASVKPQALIGAYRLQAKLGEGGMGQVWLAEQTAPVKRQVALKLIKGGIFGGGSLQRFQAERQSLAIMDHPSIAKVFDAGATPDGQPYFVMEYVAGLPITEYCDSKALPIRERLELFIKVCDAVQHAHQKAIIHRDLKPANILVVEVDGKPLPRIIDFGLAKTLASEASSAEAQYTYAGNFVGTPEYMSPEQADPNALDVDTRTDVYSLGVVLYVLLTGTLPFQGERQGKLQVNEVLRQLREDDPPRPSTRAKTDSSKKVAEARGAEPKQLAGALRGDPDWITMKALEKDRVRRYATPSALAEDLRRYLRNEPVMARPASTAYKLRKYVRRHAVGVTVGLATAVLLVSFGVVQAAQLRRITRERDRANRITDFMTEMFQVADPSEGRGSNVTAREVLDKASKQIDTSLEHDPELQAQMMQIMGTVYSRLGVLPVAQQLLQRAITVGRSTGGPADATALTAMNVLGSVLLQEGRLVDAEKVRREALDLQRRTLGPHHPDTLTTMADLAAILAYEGHLEEAISMDRVALVDQQRVLGADNDRTMMTMDVFAAMLSMAGHLDESERLEKQLIDKERRIFGSENARLLPPMANLADTLYLERKYSEAKQLLHDILAIQRPVYGPDHPALGRSLYNLGCVAAREGNRDEAFTYINQAVDRLSARGVPDVLHDPELNSLHSDPRFETLLARTKNRAGTGRCPL